MVLVYSDNNRSCSSYKMKRAIEQILNWQRHTRLSRGCDTSQHLESPAGPLASLPFEVLEEIFMNLPPHQVVCVCRLVCHEWKEVADSQSLWRERSRRERYQPCDPTKLPQDWRVFYFLFKKRRNLLKNPRGDDDLNDWQILKNGGDKWKIVEMTVELPDNSYSAVQNVFVTSYYTCKKSQLIDLEKEGYSPAFMDHLQPDIRICDWHAPTWQIGCKYTICVELLDQRMRPIQTFAPRPVFYERGNDIRTFEQMTVVLRNYGPGVRYIRFTHGGRDNIYWAGWWGARMTNSTVEICPVER